MKSNVIEFRSRIDLKSITIAFTINYNMLCNKIFSTVHNGLLTEAKGLLTKVQATGAFLGNLSMSWKCHSLTQDMVGRSEESSGDTTLASRKLMKPTPPSCAKTVSNL